MIDERELMIIRQVVVKATADLFSMRDFTTKEMAEVMKFFEAYILGGK